MNNGTADQEKCPFCSEMYKMGLIAGRNQYLHQLHPEWLEIKFNIKRDEIIKKLQKIIDEI